MSRTLLQLCLFFYLYLDVYLGVNAGVSGFNFLNKSLRLSRLIRQIKLDDEVHFFCWTEEFLLSTPGCVIPNNWTNYRIEETNDCNNSCGIRAVHIVKNAKENVIKYTIDEKEMNLFFGNKSYECCFQFAYRLPNDKMKFTNCQPFENGSSAKLEHEVIVVTCQPKNVRTKNKVYKDAYIVLKEIEKKDKTVDKESWNVLIIGIDSMSRARAIQSMPKLVKYFKKNSWLDYRAYQKVAKSTFSNVMNLLTGKKSSTYDKACRGNMSRCNDLMIWSKFKKSGYVTAHGEDHLPDTFNIKNQIKMRPTDHYIRPLFLLREKKVGNIVCVKKIPAALHVLSYANQFVKAYKDVKFFGFFWMISYSHDPNHIPALLQNDIVNFFEDLNDFGALNNTIIFFLGDHGIRFGKLKIPVASHYDANLPMLFIWVPYSFRKRLKAEYENLQLNQHRLITHCDVHATLWNILKLSDESVEIIPPEACPRCSSLFEEKSINRSCRDINVSEKWCSCHVLNEVGSNDIASTLVPKFMLSKVPRAEKGLKIESVLRHHWYKNNYDKDNITYYVIAIQVTPSNRQYEGIIKYQNSKYTVLDKVDTISITKRYYDTSLCKPTNRTKH